MSCASVVSGGHFLSGVLTQIDCQAQTIGAYGYGALADPNSPAAGLLLALLTIFIALFGIRLMFGEVPRGQALVGDMLRIGIAVTLATSWPAWRSLAYDSVFFGPGQIAGSIGAAAGLPGSGSTLIDRLDNADQGIVALTAFGTGRLTGGVVGSTDLGDSTRGIALADQSGFAWGRIAFLIGAIGPLALVKLGAGILLALAPIMAGLLLFAGLRPLFIGWLRALGACALGALALALCYGAELGILEGWLRGVLVQRQGNLLTPAAPTELIVITLAFALVSFGALGLVLRLMFFTNFEAVRSATLPDWPLSAHTPVQAKPPIGLVAAEGGELPRAQIIADAVAASMRREAHPSDHQVRLHGMGRSASSAGYSGPSSRETEPLGSSYRRTYRRSSAFQSKRDGAP